MGVGEMKRDRFWTGLALVALLALAGCEASDDGRDRNFDGPWTRHTIDDSLRGADGVRVADVNGDGLPDVATGWEEGDATRVYLHPGPDDVRDRWPAVTVGRTPSAEDAMFVDLDDDGHVDVVSCLEGHAQRVIVNWGPSDPDDILDPEAWESEAIEATMGRSWMFAVPMDVDGQRGIDLVIGAKQEGAVLAWLESPDDPRDLGAWTLHEIAPAGWVMSIDVADINGDGSPDILVSDRQGPSHGVYWYEHPDDPDTLRQPWVQHLVGARGRSPVFLGPVFDGNGRLEGIVVPSGATRLTLYGRENEAGDLWSEQDIPYPKRLGTPKAAAIGDIDLDGELDVAVSCTDLSGWEDGVVWLPSAALPGDGTEPEKMGISGAQGEKFDRMELIDLDRDGDLDVLTTEEEQGFGVIWYENPMLPAEDED